jgi:hypothetical protein
MLTPFKFKRDVNASLLVFIIVILSGCKDDEAVQPVRKLTAADQTYSLKNAKVYLRAESETEGVPKFLYRTYLITDGEIVSGGGFSETNYENETFFIVIQLGIPEGGEWSTGEFLQYRNWGDAPNDANVSFFTSLFMGELDEYYRTHDTENTPLLVKGGIDPGDKVSFTFTGKFGFERLETTSGLWIVTSENSTLSFTGKIIDKRI